MPTSNWMGGRYALGITNPPATLESNGIPDPYPAELQPYTELVAAGDNSKVMLGRPIAKWTWGMLEQHQLNYILGLVSEGSRRVYITTRVPSGVTMTYNTFSAIMNYPAKMASKPGGLWEGVDVEFVDLVNAEIP